MSEEPKPEDPNREVSDTQEMARKLAEACIYQLGDHNGFDHWWHDIDQEDQDNIVTELADQLHRVMTGVCAP